MKSWFRAVSFLCVTAISVSAQLQSGWIHDPACTFSEPGDFSACFSLPCHGCFEGATGQLALRLNIPSSNLECANSIPRLNEVSLAEDNSKNDGSFQFFVDQPGGVQRNEVHASWQRICLNGEATLLSVHFFTNPEENKSATSKAGFTVSFTQKETARILRFEGAPIEDISKLQLPGQWLQTEETPLSDAKGETGESNSTADGDLSAEYKHLDELRQHAIELRQKIFLQEQKILMRLRGDIKSCKSVGCWIKSVIAKAPGFLHLFKSRFHCIHKHKHSSCTLSQKFQEPVSSKPCEHFKPPHEGGKDSSCLPPPPPKHHRPEFDVGESTAQKPTDGFESIPPHHGRPHKHPHHFDHPHHPRPHILPPAPRHPYFKLILATFALVSVSLIFLGLFILLRLYLSNPRVQADRAARLEECRTRRAYRRAVCKHKLKQFISRFRRRSDVPTTDYEEKRETLRRRMRLNSTSSSSNGIMRSDIDSLRRAQELVGELVRAEEGRAQSHRVTAYETDTQNPTPLGERAFRSDRSETSLTMLPPYVAPPPRYSQELSRDMLVVDGFRYTPTQSQATPSSSASSFMIDDDATESSVVDCRSRMSLDTEREPRSKKSLELAGDRMRRDF